MNSWIKSIKIALCLAILALGIGVMLFVVTTPFIKTSTVIKSPIKNGVSYDYLKSVTVRIIQNTERGSFIGTGSVVKITNDYTYILTNKHVAPMESRDGIYVIDEYSNKIKAEVCSNSFVVDLSLIRVKGLIENKQAVTSMSRVKHSDKVYSVGMYLGYNYIYTEGTMAGYNREDSYVMNLPGAGGCSGSGVFNENGDLVAVIFAGNYINYPYQVETAKMLCINTGNIRMFLHRNGINL